MMLAHPKPLVDLDPTWDDCVAGLDCGGIPTAKSIATQQTANLGYCCETI